MAALQYKLVYSDEGANITVFANGEMYPATQDHPEWDRIVEGAKAGDVSVVELFDLSAKVAKHFERLTDRVSVANGLLYLDGDAIHNSLSDEVIRFVEAGVDNWKPLVAFFEKVQTNPQEYSREQLYSWLTHHEFTITSDGDIVGYKGVSVVADGYTSKSQGTATVNGVVHTGRIPQKVGDVVEMPRSAVAFDPSQGCSAGLHVANWSFAKGFASGGAVLTVAVNPRDWVSVPSDSSFHKGRVCRYKVLGVTEFEIPDVVYDVVDDDEDEDYCGDCEDCGDTDCDGFCTDTACGPVRIPAGQPGAGQFAKPGTTRGVTSNPKRVPAGYEGAGQFVSQKDLWLYPHPRV